jgi:hypothetical protein
MEDMERRIKRGDAKQEKLDAIQVGLFPPNNEAHADIGCHALLSVKPVNQDAWFNPHNMIG